MIEIPIPPSQGNRRPVDYGFDLNGLELTAAQRRQIADRVRRLLKEAEELNYARGFQHGTRAAVDAVRDGLEVVAVQR